jgi:hypothetical protein
MSGSPATGVRTRGNRVALSAAQLDALAAVARADVAYSTIGGHYRRRDLGAAVRSDTMNVLIAAGLAALPPAQAGQRAHTVAITAAGRALLSAEDR